MTAGIGDYVLATKYSDGDPQDHFCVGFLARIDGDRYIVVDRDGVVVRPNGFRRAEKITTDEGDRLVAMFPEIGDRPGPSLWAHLYRMRYGSTNIMERSQMITDEQVRRAVEYTGSKKNSDLRIVIDDSIWLAECMITEGRLIIEVRSREMPGYGYGALVDRHPKAEVLDEDADSESLSTMIVGAIMMARHKQFLAAEELKQDGKDNHWDLPGEIYVCNEIGWIAEHHPHTKRVKWLDGRVESVSLENIPSEMADLPVGIWFQAKVHRGPNGRLKRIADAVKWQPPPRRSPEERREILKTLKSPPPVEDDLLLDQKKDHNQRMREIAELAVESMEEPKNDEELERWARKLGNQWSRISEDIAGEIAQDEFEQSVDDLERN
jgi:hypothetical protein